MKNILLISGLIIVGLTLTQCEKTITISNLPYEDELSVECILEANQTPVLYLGKTVAYFDTLTANADYFVDNALVTIRDSLAVDTLTVTTTFNYFSCSDEYYYAGHISIVRGHQYHLKIVYGGQIYEADTRVNLPSASIDSLTFVASFVDLFGEHEGVVVDFMDLPGQSNYYRYKMSRIMDISDTANVSNCAVEPYYATEIGRSVYFDTNIDGAPMTLVIEPAFKHEEGDTALVYIQSLDAATARFFDDLDRQKNSKINPFIEPVFITSNIPGAFGIFGVARSSLPVKFVYPE